MVASYTLHSNICYTIVIAKLLVGFLYLPLLIQHCTLCAMLDQYHAFTGSPIQYTILITLGLHSIIIIVRRVTQSKINVVAPVCSTKHAFLNCNKASQTTQVTSGA